MADTWAAQWAGQWAAGAQRFNHVHAPAGSATGGQFAASSGSGAKASGSKSGGAGKSAPSGHAAQKAALLAKAKADRAKAHQLQVQLKGLIKQEATAHAAAVKSAATAKKSATIMSLV